MIKRTLLLAAFAATPLAAQTHPADSVSEDRLKGDVEKLVSFGTRHTMSVQDDPERGIGAAVDWGLAEFKRIGAKCGDCLEVLPVGETVTGPRIPTPTLVRNAVAIQRGTDRPNEVVIVQGHIDSRVTDVMDATSDAPGANDDGSGTALVLESARALSGTKYPTTIIYALLSGEEQGLHGGRILADWATEQGYTVKAVLNNDIVGNSCGKDGYCEPKVVRVFSEGPRADLTERLRASQTRFGGENDSPGRNLSRWVADLAGKTPDGLQVRQIWRTDRMGRGGDQVPFLQKGYPAIRFSVGVEDYDHQHQDLRTENGVFYGDTVGEMDFAYLAGVTRLNVRALDALARAPMPPKVTVDAAVRVDTELKWQAVPGASLYTVATRPTDQPEWGGDVTLVYIDGPIEANRDAAEQVREFSHVKALRGDDWLFGVSACAWSPEGSYCSPVASAVPGGGFEPVAKE